ncbi:BamA/TamA family outer membrane protein [Plectonema radiosum NIES-515]|uniref:BamA/TamA family outer membrane protein n=1 Tax=Plectonema radiosum NIES-515 TaxID=2986073 RepID=A0ABT3AUL2_9CYAN|nr:BamA/TamA family outer membrane protein [Plectonema radiosum]MCV3212822.1 BamA/TamA family outer membrane protein [Plectonema radiosum NIES-515]
MGQFNCYQDVGNDRVLDMRIQIVILIVGMLVSWSYEVRAEGEPEDDTNLPSIVETHTENISQPLPTSLPSVERAEVSDKIVKDIQIRFLNNKDKWVDEKGRLIEGRTPKNFIIDNLRLKPGQIFRNDLFQKDLERLRRLNSFAKVNFVLEDSDTGVNIVYYIRENKFPSWSFGGGDNGDVGLYGKLGYTDANINGLNEQLDTSIQVSGKDVQFDTSFISPYRRGEPSRLGYSFRAFRERDLSRTFNDDIKLANGSTAREGRFGGSLAVLKSFDDWDAALGLNYTRISLRDRDYNVAQVDRLGTPLSVSGTGIDDLVTVSFAISNDQRDRRRNPTKGSLLTLSTEQAIPIGLGKIASNRLQANYILYVPVTWIGSNGSTENTEMIALNLQAGTNIGEFPPANAFELGGQNSVRGYGGGRVASARSYGLASFEYRFPILHRVGGVLFADFASDFGSSKTVLGEPGIVRGKPGSGFGYGLGLRVKSPFGLIRGDLGVSDQGEVKFEVTTDQRF